MIVRHGQPDSGTADPVLSANGHAQAEALAKWLLENPSSMPDRVVTSPLRRAHQTASAIAEVCGVELESDARLAEFDADASEYVAMEHILAADAAADPRAQLDTALITGRWGRHRFDPEAFRARVDEGLRDLAADTRSGRIAAVCHGGVINSFLSTVVGRPYGGFFRPRYTSFSRIEVTPAGTLHVFSLNELPHAGLTAAEWPF